MTTVSLRIDKKLALQAEHEAKIQSRSRTKQLEYWAKLGKVISTKLNIKDIYAVSHGLKTIKLEVPPSAQSIHVDSDVIFNNLENDRAEGLLAKNITSAKTYYEASVTQHGYLDRVDSSTGERQTGFFEDGSFKEL